MLFLGESHFAGNVSIEQIIVEKKIILRLLWTEAEPFVYRKRLEKTNEGEKKETERKEGGEE
jgi:hypothetical protein